MHGFVCVLIYVVHKDNGTSGSSVRDVALSVGFGLYIHTDVAQCLHHQNRHFHQLYIDKRYPGEPRTASWGPPTCSREREEEEEERWEMKKAVVKSAGTGQRCGPERVSKLEQTTGETGDYRGRRPPCRGQHFLVQ